MKKKIIKIISLVSIIMIILSSIPVFGSELQTATEWESKISDELLEIMDTKSNTELIPVYIWLNDIDHEIIRKAMIDEKGMNPAIYENDELFKKEIVPEIEAKIVERVGYEKAHEKVENSAYVLDSNGAYHDDTMSLVDRAIQAKTNEYIMAKRSISKREHSAFVNEFVEEYVNEDRELISVGEYVTCVIVEATKEEIKKYASLKDVEKVSFFENHTYTDKISVPLDQVDAGYFGTKGSSYNNGNGLKGTGIKIGVIEGGIFASTCPHLSPIVDTKVFLKNDAGTNNSAIMANVSDHASVVTSIIVGQPITIDNVTYEGVVPLATVYQTPIKNNSNIYRALNNMASRGVTVINMSICYDPPITDPSEDNHGEEYNYVDEYFDKFIFETGVNIVVAAGNNSHDGGNGTGDISSPGKAFNTITVGMADTLNSSFTALPYPYAMNDESSMYEASYLPNKPDVSAPGKNIQVVKNISNSESVFYYNGSYYGTSFAAPIVTGIVAQIQQSGGISFCILPALTKSVLVTAADPTLIRTSTSTILDSDNVLVGCFLWEKSGAGLVNAANAVSISSYTMGILYTEGQKYTTGDIPFLAGDHLRATLTFEKEHSGLVSSTSPINNLNFYLLDVYGNKVFENNTEYDNVVIIDFEIPTSGYYKFQVEAVELAASSELAYYYSWNVT